MGLRFFLSLSFILTVATAVELPERNDSQPLKWWQEDVVYQIYPRSHQDSDGDGVGDLKGIEQRLDHFVDIGIKSVWISPIYKSPMVDFGYDIEDFMDIDPIFGTMQDFEYLKRAMDAREIKLIMDFVPNHSSDQHEWFRKSIQREEPYSNYYVWRNKTGDNENGPIPPNNWLSVFGGSAWRWNAERGQFYLHQFTAEQPDLNFENEAVIQEMLQIITFWSQKGVDGFRIDAVPHLFEDQNFEDESFNPNPPEGARCTPLFDHSCLVHDKTYNLPGVFVVLRRFRQLLDVLSESDGKERVMMVEASVPTLDMLFEYYGTESQPIAHYPFNFEFINRIRSGFNGNNIQDLVNEWFEKMPAGRTANWLLGNHDNHRVATRFSEDMVDPLNMINLLLPGSAVTYYGEEIGMSDHSDISWEETRDPPACNAGPDRYKEFSRDPERTPMHWNGERNAGFSSADKTWLPMQPDFREVNVESQLISEMPSHLQIYKEIMKLRNTDVWRYGSLESFSIDGGKLFGFARIYKEEGFIYLGNFGTETATVNLTSIFKNIPEVATVQVLSKDFLPSTPIGLDVRTSDITIGGRHAMILVFPSVGGGGGGYDQICNNETWTCREDLSCINGKCACRFPDHQFYDNSQRVCISMVLGPCKVNDLECQCTENSECTGDILPECVCQEGYSRHERKCLAQVGTKCEVNDDCFGTGNENDKNPICKEDVCSCADLEVFDDAVGKCRGLVGAICGHSNDTCIDGVECEFFVEDEGICRCMNGEPTSDRRCR